LSPCILLILSKLNKNIPALTIPQLFWGIVQGPPFIVRSMRNFSDFASIGSEN